MGITQKRMLVRGVDIALAPLDDKPVESSELIELWLGKRFEGVFKSAEEAISYVKHELAEPQGSARVGSHIDRRLPRNTS